METVGKVESKEKGNPENTGLQGGKWAKASNLKACFC